jgi:hypothetical protein
MDTIRVSKTINAPLSYVFSWCTDFSEDDPKITGSKSQRKILEKTKKRVIYAQLYNDEKGQQKVAVDIVSLKSPRYWHLDYFGEEDDETGEYKLTRLGKNKTRLDMLFKEKWKISNPPTKAWQVQHTNEIWDKYIAALEHDYNSEERRS